MPGEKKELLRRMIYVWIHSEKVRAGNVKKRVATILVSLNEYMPMRGGVNSADGYQNMRPIVSFLHGDLERLERHALLHCRVLL
jgi:hypothetical protein